MRTKVTLVLIFLNAALFFFIFKFERNWRTEAASLEARKTVLGPEAANIQSLEITRPDGVFALTRSRDAWQLTKPLDWPANPHAVSSILNELQLLEHETSFRVADLAKTNRSLAEYGLENPPITVAFRPGGAAGVDTAQPPIVLRIGDLTKDGKRLYLLSPDGERVHVVSRTLLDTLAFPLDQLRADSLLTIQQYEAKTLVVQIASSGQDRGGSATGLPTRISRDGAQWKFYTPIIARANTGDVNTAITDLNALRPRTFNPPPPAAPAGDNPELRIRLEGNNRYETLLLREPVTPPAPRASGQPATIEYYAELEGRSARFTVAIKTSLLETLRNAQQSLRDKRVVDEFDPATVTAITIEAPISSTPALTLQRLDATAGAGPNTAPQWQAIQTDGANQGPRPLPADRAAVQRFLEWLALLNADSFKSDAPTSADLEEWGFNRPERQITLTFAGSKLPVVLRLGTDAATPRNVYAQVGTKDDHGSSIYKVIVDPRRDIPTELADWRDRMVRGPLPAGARFTALKITDLASKEVVFESNLNPAGEPANPPRTPKAVPDLLAQLRTLRAKRFLSSAFAEKIPVAGEERPWRYQLEATIALPGGGGESSSTMTLFFTDRLGASQQYAGSSELDVMFEIEQPLLDALWSLVARDPGPPEAVQPKA